MPDITFTHAMEDGLLKRINPKKNWSKFFYMEILEAAKQKVHHRYLACGEYLTRIAYFLIGAINYLPPPFRPLHPVALLKPHQKGKGALSHR